MATLQVRRVALSEIDAEERARLTRRRALLAPEVRRRAEEIVAAVRSGGDDALRDASLRYGGGAAGGPTALPPDRLQAALDAIDPSLRAALAAAAAAIEACHRPQRPQDHVVDTAPGVRVERKWAPLQRVAVYVPGGGASYPSSLLMGAIPARIAGVPEVVVATPAAADGAIPRVVLASAALAGVTEVHAMGGAQAIAALAYGTETIRPVEKIVGPGNAWVTAAKLAVFGDVAIDLPAGPSEALVIDDGSTPARLVAADMICQAEHGPDSPVMLVTTGAGRADAVLSAADALLSSLGRGDIVAKALTDHGLLVIADGVAGAVAFANEYAPEHLSLHVRDAAAAAEKIVNAGSVFVGRWAPESAGDYATGANHILPTGGRAVDSGPLSVDDFGSWRQVQHITREGLETLLPTITALADAEGLDAHKLAATIRFESGGS